MKHIKVFETTSALNTWKAAHSEVNPYAYFCIDSGITYYQPFINANGHAYVDLGLPSGTLWATMNIGATAVGQMGGYYSWGETSTKSDYSWSTYAWGTEDALTKYNATDGKYCLDLEDDVAHVLWGGDWHIPSNAQIEELSYYVNGYYDEDLDSNGYQSTINDGVLVFYPGGPNIGFMDGTELARGSQYGRYFQSNELDSGSFTRFPYFYDEGEGFGPSSYTGTGANRYVGMQVRAVIGTLDVFNYPPAEIQ